MKSVLASQIPKFLINSNLYEQIYKELSKDEEISISENHFINEIKPKNIQDFSRVLDVLRYWMVNEIPDEIFKFIEEHPKLDYDELFKTFSDFPFTPQLKLLLDFVRKEEFTDVRRAKNCFIAIYRHRPDLVKLIMDTTSVNFNAYAKEILKVLTDSKLDVIENKRKFINLIAKNDYVDLLKYLYGQEDYNFSEDFLDICVIENSSVCLTYMKDKCTLYQRLSFVAAAFGHYEILKMLHQSGCRISDLTALAACTSGDVKCYKYVSEQTKLKNNYVTTAEQMKNASSAYLEQKETVKRASFQSIGMFGQLINNYSRFWPNVLPGFVMPTLDPYAQNLEDIEKQIMTFLEEFGNHLNLKSLYTTVATLNDNIDLLKELCNDGYKIENIPLGMAIKNQNVEIVKFCLENIKSQIDNGDNFEFMTGLTCTCGINGNLEILKLLHKYGCQLDTLCIENAAFKGHFEIVKYCHESGSQLTSKVIDNAACKGHLDVLKYLLDNNCPIDGNVYTTIVDFGAYKHSYSYANPKPNDDVKITCTEEEKREKRLIMLKLVHQKELSNGNVSWSDNASTHACKNGDLGTLKYLSENGCDLNVKKCLVGAINSGNFELIKLVYTLYNLAKQKGNLAVDQTPFLSQLGAISMAGYLVADPKTQFCDTACKNKNLEVLKFLREKGFEWSTQAYNQVLTGGYDSNSKNPNIKRNTEIEMIKYLHENGCKWDSVVLGTAAVNGHIDCLKYIHQNGGELSTDTYFPSQMISSCVDSYASCTFDINNIETDTENIKQKHFECLKYLCENGLKLDKVCLFRAQETKNQELIDYVKSVYVDEPVPKKKKFGGLMDMFNGLMNKNQDDSDYDDLTIGSSESEDELEL